MRGDRPTLYPPGGITPLPAGTRAPQGERVWQVGTRQRDILVRCRSSPGWGTLVRRDSDWAQAYELRAARGLHDQGLAELRTFGRDSIGWLWVILLTEAGRDGWLGMRATGRRRIDS